MSRELSGFNKSVEAAPGMANNGKRVKTKDRFLQQQVAAAVMPRQLHCVRGRPLGHLHTRSCDRRDISQ